MDPIIIAIAVVVVVHLTLLFLLIRGSFMFHGEHLGTVTITHTANEFHHETTNNSQTTLKASVEMAVQTDDSDIFFTCYEHVEAQRQENLLSAEVLDETVETFQDSLYNIQDRLDKNFQFLTIQLRAEFDSYLQYALGIQTGQCAEVPAPHNLENPALHQYPPIPDLVTLYYQPITQFENFEIKLANEDINRQSQGGRPLGPLKTLVWLTFRTENKKPEFAIYKTKD